MVLKPETDSATGLLRLVGDNTAEDVKFFPGELGVFQLGVFLLGGDDTVRGSSDAELIYGNSDNDQLFGEGGNDTLFGGVGDDRFFQQTLRLFEAPFGCRRNALLRQAQRGSLGARIDGVCRLRQKESREQEEPDREQRVTRQFSGK